MNSRVDFLYLNEQEMILAGVKEMDKCIDSIEDMFVLLENGDYRMGGENANEHGVRVSFPKSTDIDGMPVHKPDYRFMAMPAYLGGRFKAFGIKTCGSNPDNSQLGLPRSILMMQLLDATTGVPLAYMSANILSAMRTGAASGVGARHLSVRNPRTLAIVGPGAISKYVADAIITAQPTIDAIRIKGRSKIGVEKYISFCKNSFPNIKEYTVCDSLDGVCDGADIVLFATTNAERFEDNPTVKKEWLKKGALVISVSSLLVDASFLSNKDVKLISDNYAMYEDWGKGNTIPTQKTVSTLLGMGFYDAVMDGVIDRKSITDIGEVIVGKKTGRDSDEQIVLYAVGGMPIEDVAWAYDVYLNALEKGIGSKLCVWESPNL